MTSAFGLTCVCISHDLNVGRFVADRVMVMYLGRIAEIGPADDVFAAPRHPYAAALLRFMPSMDPDRRTEEAPITGDPPSPINPPPGCRFHTRCVFAEAVCARRKPTLATGPHGVACLMHEPGSGHSRAAVAA